MAEITNGFLQGMTGSLGNLVFYKRKGKTVVRQKPGPRAYVPSEQQVFQQKAFSVGQKFLTPLRKVLDQLHKLPSSRKEDGVNSALSWLLKNAIANVNGEPVIIPENLFLHRGQVGFLEEVEIQRISAGEIRLAWQGSSESDFWRQHERLVVIAYVPEPKLVHLIKEGNYRKDGAHVLLLPWTPAFEGEVLIFGGFYNLEKNKQEYTDIRFLGKV